MENFFDQKERVENLKGILESWEGTPWRHHCGVKGLGVDCIHFVGKVFEELGLIRWRKGIIPDYPKDWHYHNTKELLIERLTKEMNLEAVPPPSVRDGDIVVCQFGKVGSHAAIYLAGYMYHSITNIGVQKTHISDHYFQKRITAVYRVKE